MSDYSGLSRERLIKELELKQREMNDLEFQIRKEQLKTKDLKESCNRINAFVRSFEDGCAKLSNQISKATKAAGEQTLILSEYRKNSLKILNNSKMHAAHTQLQEIAYLLLRSSQQSTEKYYKLLSKRITVIAQISAIKEKLNQLGG